MNPRSIFTYQFGVARGIDDVAQSRWSIFIGIFLVLLTSIARNYDQVYWRSVPYALFGPLIFSTISGSFLFLIFHLGSRKYFRSPKPPFLSQYGSFMALFWMTAPIAWLYALPVERYFSKITAAQMNLGLLAIVSIWRILLMSRALSHTSKSPFTRTLLLILLAAGFEVLFIFVFGGGLAKNIMRSMAGIRNAPEEDLFLHALNSSFFIALGMIFVGALGVGGHKWSFQPVPFPKTHFTLPPISTVVLLIFLTLFWIAVAFKPQQELQRWTHVHQLFQSKQYRPALDFLVTLGPAAFPPSKYLPPNPYERDEILQLPGTLSALQPNDPRWLISLNLDYFVIVLQHRFPILSKADFIQCLRSLEKLDPGQIWRTKNKSVIQRVWTIFYSNESVTEDISDISKEFGLE